jgi:hypothetical protein
MKIRAQITMVLNLDVASAAGTRALHPRPFLPRASLGKKGAESAMHLSHGVEQ